MEDIVKSIELSAKNGFLISRGVEDPEHEVVVPHYSIIPKKDERINIGFKPNRKKGEHLYSMEFIKHSTGKLQASLYFDDMELEEMIKGLLKLQLIIDDIRRVHGRNAI